MAQGDAMTAITSDRRRADKELGDETAQSDGRLGGLHVTRSCAMRLVVRRPEKSVRERQCQFGALERMERTDRWRGHGRTLHFLQ